MLNYVIRRILLMIPTIIGITVMVFLIARLAPGRPGQLQLDGGAMDAEGARAQAEWFAKRYGHDKNLFEQYVNWWKGMFTVDIQSLSWITGENGTLLPVHTRRTPPTEYFARLPDGSWVVVTEVEVVGDLILQTDETFMAEIAADDREFLPEALEEYATPVHAMVEAQVKPIDPLDAQRDLLKRAALGQPHVVPAPVWTTLGEPVYANPLDGAKPLVERGSAWYAITPIDAMDRWQPKAIDESDVRAALADYLWDLPGELDGYVIPRHVLISGRAEEVTEPIDVESLQRLTVPADVSAPTTLWFTPPGSEQAVMLFEAKEPVPPLLVQGEEGEWARLFGPTRLEFPAATTYQQSDAAFLARLSEAQVAELPQMERDMREPRHVVFEGDGVALPEAPTERSIRRYQHPGKAFEFTLGESISSKTTVTDELSRRLPITLTISLIAFGLIYVIAIPCGMLMAVRRGAWFDTASNVTMLALWSVPTVLSATLFIGYLAKGGSGVEWFPSNGLTSLGSERWAFTDWLLDRASHLVLPIICIVYGGVAYLAKQMRASMLDNFTMDYVRTARAKGVPGRSVVLRHVLRNSLLPLITIFATILPVLIAGSIIVETMFGIEGMGRLAFRAVQNRDYDVVQSLALIAGVLNLIGLLLADICYALADPRITYS